MIRQLTESERSLIAIAFSIAESRFRDNASSVCVRQVSETFTKQAEQIAALNLLFAGADTIRVEAD